MNENLKQNILQVVKQLEGQTISLDNALDNMRFIDESKRLAKEHEWLFHCTTDTALISILKNRELWLSNLKLVNDKEEIERVDVPEYEKTYYVSCFTYDPKIPEEHWLEYGNIENGVLIGIKPTWIEREAIFMNTDNQKCEDEFWRIFKNQDEALKYKVEQQLKRKITNPYYINAFGFYQVIYDDTVVKTIKGNGTMDINGAVIPGRTLTPGIAGIIKSTKGMCQRWGKEPYMKDWTSEKEVRLKVGIQQFDIFKNGYENHDGMIVQNGFFPKVAIPVSGKAFDEIKIKFSPNFKNQEEYLEKLNNILPDSAIEVI